MLLRGFSVWVTEWRTQFRRTMNELDSKAHTRAIDALLNYETVKYFNNEAFETKRYEQGPGVASARRRSKSQATLSMLNTGQQLIIAFSLVAMLWRATQGVVDGRLTLGDLVMVNAFLIQLYIPLNFLGVMYREVKQSIDRPGPHVRAARARARGRRCARCAAAAGARRRGALRARLVRL